MKHSEKCKKKQDAAAFPIKEGEGSFPLASNLRFDQVVGIPPSAGFNLFSTLANYHSSGSRSPPPVCLACRQAQAGNAPVSPKKRARTENTETQRRLEWKFILPAGL
jgi:hypothetical protein